MILTIQQGADSYQLKAPVFELERDEWCLLVDGSTVSLTDMEEYRPDDPDYGYLVLGSTATVVEDRVAVDIITECEMPKSLRKIKTINGVVPNDQGDFFIDGSDCDSWQYNNSVNPTGIQIVDLCPACTSCETIYRLKYEVENLKLWLNTLKDVSLYWSRIYDNRQDHVGQRRELLNSLRITGGTLATSCGEGFTGDDRYMQLKGIQLLQQYMTVIHMWNYVVSRNNSSTLITIAPEDTTGFVVQTKRALTSCADAQGIRCTIDVKPLYTWWDKAVEPGGYPADYPISVYVPDGSNKVEFEPFNEATPEQALHYVEGTHTGIITKMTVNTLSDISAQPTAHKFTEFATVPESDSDTPIPTYIDAKVAGTYVVTTKFLPFIYYRAWRIIKGKKVYIKIRGGQAQTVDGEPVGVDGATVYDFGIAGHSQEGLENPTEADYLDAKTVPTVSVPFKIVWQISINWFVRDKDGVKKETEDYQYFANGIRSFFGDIISNTTVLPLEPEEPESSGEQS